MPAFSIWMKRSTSTGLTPETPNANVRARSSIIARTTSDGSGVPTAVACERTMFALEAGGLRWVDPNVREAAEPRGDPIDRLTGRDRLLDDLEGRSEPGVEVRR